MNYLDDINIFAKCFLMGMEKTNTAAKSVRR
jgi:hypothetical protein